MESYRRLVSLLLVGIGAASVVAFSQEIQWLGTAPVPAASATSKRPIASGAISYTILDLGDLCPGYLFSFSPAWGVNNLGQVSGFTVPHIIGCTSHRSISRLPHCS